MIVTLGQHIDDGSNGKGAVNEKRNRAAFRMGEAMDFSTTKRRSSSTWGSITTLCHQILKWHGVPQHNVKVAPPDVGVYFHPQILTLRVHLSLTDFIRQVLSFYNVAPIHLTSGA